MILFHLEKIDPKHFTKHCGKIEERIDMPDLQRVSEARGHQLRKHQARRSLASMGNLANM
jgi:hypothetical protein